MLTRSTIWLEEIRRSLDDPRFDRRRALLEQREQVKERAEHAARVIRAIDRALEAIDERGDVMSIDMREIFDGFDPDEHEAETRER